MMLVSEGVESWNVGFCSSYPTTDFLGHVSLNFSIDFFWFFCRCLVLESCLETMELRCLFEFASI